MLYLTRVKKTKENVDGQAKEAELFLKFGRLPKELELNSILYCPSH